MSFYSQFVGKKAKIESLGRTGGAKNDKSTAAKVEPKVDLLNPDSKDPKVSDKVTSEEDLSNEVATMQEDDDYSSSDWVEIDAKKTGLFGWRTTYTTSNGTVIDVSEIGNGKVRENKVTGEIVIEGLDINSIDGSNDENTITVYDSNIDNINLGNKNDNVVLHDSTVRNLNARDGNDNIVLDKSTAERINGDAGENSITVDNSTVRDISGWDGNENIIIKNQSTITGAINAQGGDDSIYIENSTVNEASGNNGDDTIIVENSKVKNLYGGRDNDTFLVTEGKIENLKAEHGDDSITLNTSTVQSLEGAGGADDIKSVSSFIVQNVNFDKKNDKLSETQATTEADSVEELVPADVLSAEIAEAAAAKYIKSGTYTDEQVIQAVMLDYYTQSAASLKAGFEAQENEDGWVSDGYNWIKEVLSAGISKDDIKDVIASNDAMLAEMTKALNGEGDKTFAQVFEQYMGVPYDQNNILDYMEKGQEYSTVAVGLNSTLQFESLLSTAKNINDAKALFSMYYGDEVANDKFNDFLANVQSENPKTFGIQGIISVNKNNELVKTNEAGEELPLTEDELKAVNSNLSCFTTTKFEEEYKNNVQSTYGKSIDEIAQIYGESQLKAVGKTNVLQKVLDKYCEDQNTYAEKLASICQIGGIAMMVVGGIATIFCPPLGLGLMKAGNIVSQVGMYMDNAMEAADDLTSENGMSEQELADLAKETVTEVALQAAGRGINTISEGLGGVVLTKTQSKALSWVAEKGSDVALSLASDLVITGNVDLQGEGLSQALSIVTGILGAKAKTKAIELQKVSVDADYVEIPKTAISDPELPLKTYGSEIGYKFGDKSITVDGVDYDLSTEGNNKNLIALVGSSDGHSTVVTQEVTMPDGTVKVKYAEITQENGQYFAKDITESMERAEGFYAKDNQPKAEADTSNAEVPVTTNGTEIKYVFGDKTTTIDGVDYDLSTKSNNKNLIALVGSSDGHSTIVTQEVTMPDGTVKVKYAEITKENGQYFAKDITASMERVNAMQAEETLPNSGKKADVDEKQITAEMINSGFVEYEIGKKSLTVDGVDYDMSSGRNNKNLISLMGTSDGHSTIVTQEVTMPDGTVKVKYAEITKENDQYFAKDITASMEKIKKMELDETSTSSPILGAKTLDSFVSGQKLPQKVAIELPKEGAVFALGNNSTLDFNSPAMKSKLAGMKDGDIIVLGRNDINPNDAGISRNHLQIIKTGGKLYINDISFNGTRIIKPEINSSSQFANFDSQYLRKVYGNNPNFWQISNDVYDRIRKTEYSPESTFKKGVAAMQNAIDEKPIDGYNIEQNGWCYRKQRGVSFDGAVERMSLNVTADPSLLKELDTFFRTGEYIDAKGVKHRLTDSQTVMSYYKTPLTASKWTNRHDPITIYCNGKIPDAMLNAIADISSRYARPSANGVPLVGAVEGKPWIAKEASPQEDYFEQLYSKANALNPYLASAMKSQVYKHGDFLASSGQITSFEIMIAEYEAYLKTLGK